MAVRTIVTQPHPALGQKAEKIRDFDESLQKLAEDMIDTLNQASEPEGAGLAANQIGVAKRVCIVRNFFQDPLHHDKILSEDFFLVNPKIVSESKETEIDWEGCLSVPNQFGQVQRFKKIKVFAQDLEGNTFKIRASGLFSRIIQHEVDHLDGVLFTSKVIGKTLTENQLDKLLEGTE